MQGLTYHHLAWTGRIAAQRCLNCSIGQSMILKTYMQHCTEQPQSKIVTNNNVAVTAFYEFCSH